MAIKMNIKKLLSCCLLSSSFIFYTATGIADDYPQDFLHLDYSGTVVIPPCDIINPVSNVKFGIVDASDLSSANSATDWLSFSLTVTCADPTEVSVTITGTPDTDSPQYFASTGTAKHLAFEVTYLGDAVKPGGTTTYNAPGGGVASGGSGLVRIHNSDGQPATTGTVVGTLTATFTFK